MAALFVPAMVAASGLIVPARTSAEEVGHEQVLAMVGFWPVRIALFGVILLSFVHCAHRIRHILLDMGLRSLDPMLSVLCYGGALVGGGTGGWLLLRL